MSRKGLLWRCRAARLVALAAAIALAPLPVMAGEASKPAKAPPGIRASMARLGAIERTEAPRPAAMRSQQAGGEDLASASFFKRPIGIVIIATFAIGTGYALYSTQHDRVSSPGKK